jgi:hypothetical protein
MTSKSVTSFTAISNTERLALLKLVQRANETMKDQWRQDCVTAFGWSQMDADSVITRLRRLAKKELSE